MAVRSLLLLAVSVAALHSGCIGQALLTDGTSVSLGRADRGYLRGGRWLPPEGPGYVTPGPWRDRGLGYGTDELVEAIQRAAFRVADRYPGGVLGVGDLSRRGGGRQPHHKSHEAGRDADLIFYAVDNAGLPVAPPPAMPRYDRHLHSRAPHDTPPEPVAPRRFDVARNWALVAALLEDPSIEVEYLFIADRLRRPMLQYAATIGEPAALVDRAARSLRQPRHALPHDDHLHLRIRCAPSDLAQGCMDTGRVRMRSERVPRRTTS